VIGIDTNVLVRFLVEDDEAQSRAASLLISRAHQNDERLFVSDVVLCETVWVLAGAYRVPKPEIIELLGRILRARQLTFRATNSLRAALDAYKTGKGDFADYVIREIGKEAGATMLMTFDRTLLQETGFSAP
jgi:predicted nucleic-acid-binding protein